MLGALRNAAKSVVPKGWHPYELAKKRIVDETKGTVLTGPFRGLKYPVGPGDFIDHTMLLGTYEKELSPIMESLVGAQYSTLVDVGAAQGYYAVGLAMRNPAMRVIAFEANADGRDQTRRMAEANGVADRIDIRGFCTVEELRGAIDDPAHTLVIMDVEGGEDTLLDPEALPSLKSCRILVEEHESMVPGICETLLKRFTPTHEVTRIQSVPRTLADLPIDPSWMGRWLVAAMGERPDSNSWFDMRPRQEGA